jgi:hypothetical protein
MADRGRSAGRFRDALHVGEVKPYIPERSSCARPSCATNDTIVPKPHRNHARQAQEVPGVVARTGSGHSFLYATSPLLVMRSELNASDIRLIWS